MNDKRVIEDYLPIKAISKEASREKSIRKGHISTLHLWWARRPLVACRAAVYGALVPADHFRPQNGPPEKRNSLGRANAAKFLERLCKYPGNPQVIKEAQRHILEAHAERLTKETGKKVTIEDIEQGRAPRPKVLDMFAGGGAIPLEALRLGCEAYALELNPVAHIIELCTLVYPQKYGKPDPIVRGMTGPENEKGEKTWGGLAEEVRYWGNWVLEKVREEIGDLYPLIPDPESKPEDLIKDPQRELFHDKKGQQRLRTPMGYLTPVAYLWTRTVKCKNPSCGAAVPLVRQTWLCKKKGRYVALTMIAPKGEKQVRFEVVEVVSEKGIDFDPTLGSKGGNATCPFCGTVADNNYVKAEGYAKRIGEQLMGVVASRKGSRGWSYLSPDHLPVSNFGKRTICSRLDRLCNSNNITVPTEILEGKCTDQLPHFGMESFSDLFSPRQMLFLLTSAVTIRDIDSVLQSKGIADRRRKAIITVLGIAVDRAADFGSTLCVWNAYKDSGTTHVFGRQALPMVWDYSETNPFNRGNASWSLGIDRITVSLASAEFENPGYVERGSATDLPWNSEFFDWVVTDPPYYDNIQYADLSDFFYVWLKRTIGVLYPEHFASNLSPKKNEAVASPFRRFGSKEKAKKSYENMMAESFAEAHRVLKPSGGIVIVYAHKTTLGWSVLVDGLRASGFTVTEAWPLQTEKPGRLLAQQTAALASSIFLEMLEERLAGHRTAIIWPSKSTDIPNQDPLFLIPYLPLEFGDKPKKEREDEARHFLSKYGDNPRKYRNGLALAVPARDQIGVLRRAVRYLMAIELVKGKAKQHNLTDEQKSQLKERESTEKAAAESALLKLYTEVWLPKIENGRIEIESVSAGGSPLQTTLNEKKQAMIHERIMELLTIIQPRVFNTLNPGKIVNLFKLGEGKPPVTGKKTIELVDGFYSFPGFTRLSSSEIIQKSIARGVREGAFGYYAGSPPTLGEDGKYQVSESKVAYEKIVADDEIDLDMGFIMMPDAIPIAKPPEPPSPGPEALGPPPPGPEPSGPEPPPPGSTEEQKKVSITFTADRDQLFGAWQAVANLADMAGKVSVSIDAESEEGFDKNKLRNAVIEPLQEADLIE